jgi:6-phosphogluconolactonase
VAGLKAHIRVFADLDALSQGAASEFVRAFQTVALERRRFLVALNGGSTPVKLYHLLSAPPYRAQIDWAKVEVFWGDERCVPPDDPQNNYRQATDVLLGKVAVPQENLHRIRSELQPQAAADGYAIELERYASQPLGWPRFDLVLLGLGQDGHTASLFPDSEVDADRPTLAVSGHYQDRPAWRVTLTPPVFNSATRIVFLVSGSEKAGIVADVLSGEYRPGSLPAQRICPSDGDVIWMLDRAAASGLPGDFKTEKE